MISDARKLEAIIAALVVLKQDADRCIKLCKEMKEKEHGNGKERLSVSGSRST